MFYVDVDICLEPHETRSAQGQLSVQGEVRRELLAAGINSKILEERGPAGGWPVVRLMGSRTALKKWLDKYDYDGCTIYHV